MGYELTPLLGLHKPVKGSGEQFDSDIYASDLQELDDAIAADRDRLDALEAGGGITASDITDSGAAGRAVLTSASTSDAQTAIGATATGKALIAAADAAAARTAIGATTYSSQVITAANRDALRALLGLYVRTTPGAPAVGDLRTRDA